MVNCMTDNKRIAKNSFVLFVRMFVVAIMGLISSRLMLHNLGDVDFGIYSVVGGIVQMMAFFNVVLSSATQRFLTIELGKKQDLSKVFSVSVSLHFIIGFTILILGETIGLYYVYNYINIPPEKFPATLLSYQISLVASFICVMQVPFQALLISYEDFSRYAFPQILTVALMLIASYVIEFLDSGRLVLFTLLMGVAQIAGFLLYYLNSRKYRPRFQRVFDKGLIKSMTSYSTWIAVGAAAVMGRGNISNIVLNYFFGPIINTAFYISYQVSSQMSQLGQNVSKAFNPQIMKSYVQDEMQRLGGLVCYSSKYSFLLMYIVVLPFILKLRYVLNLWLGDYPDETLLFCTLLLVMALVETLNISVTPALQATGNIKWLQIIQSSVTLIVLPISYFLYQLNFPAYIMLLLFVASVIVNDIIGLILLKRQLGISVVNYIVNVYIRCLLVVLLTIPSYYIIDFSDDFPGLLFTILFTTLYILFVFFYLQQTKGRNNIWYVLLRAGVEPEDLRWKN